MNPWTGQWFHHQMVQWLVLIDGCQLQFVFRVRSGSSFSGSVFGFRVFCPPIPYGLVPLRPCMLMNDFGLDHKHDDHVQKIEACHNGMDRGGWMQRTFRVWRWRNARVQGGQSSALHSKLQQHVNKPVSGAPNKCKLSWKFL